MTELQRIQMMRSFHWTCDLCGGKATELHHKLPKALGGSDERENLMPLCGCCHMQIHLLDRGELTRKGIEKARELPYEPLISKSELLKSILEFIENEESITTGEMIDLIISAKPKRYRRVKE